MSSVTRRSFEMKLAAKDLDRARDSLDAKRAQRAIRAAMNQTANSARTTAAREVAKGSGMKVRDAKRQMRVDKAAKDLPAARVVATGRPVRLIQASRGARQTKSGVSLNRGGGSRETLAHTFLATMPDSGRRGIFVRKGQRPLPIRELFGQSVPAVMLRDSVNRAIRDHIAETLPRALTRQIDRQQRAAAGKNRR